MSIIKNTILFSIDLPDAKTLAAALSEIPFTELTEQEFSKTAFVPNEITGELVTPLVTNNNYSFRVRHDSKIIPPASVRDALKKKAAEVEAQEGRKLSRKECQVMRDEIIFDYMRVALVKTQLTDCFFDADKQLLVVATSSKNTAGMIISLLLKALGAAKNQTIHLDNAKLGLSAMLTSYIDGGNDKAVFDGFDVGNQLKLKSHLEGVDSINYSGDLIANSCDAIAENLNNGLVVDYIRLETEAVSFKLTSDFHFKSIKFADIETDEDTQDDAAFIWRQTVSTEVFLIISAAEKLMKLLGYQSGANGAIDKIIQAPAIEEGDDTDSLYPEAVRFAIETQKVSTSSLQRKLGICYNRAARLIEMMEIKGVIAEPNGMGMRTVIKKEL